MGRAKTFDEQRTLDKAMHLFWQYGYDATTYTLLEQETGISGRSLINAFGDKKELFLRALDCYQDRQECALAQILQSKGTEGIKRFFSDFVDIGVDDPRRFGCLMVNTITTVPAQEAAIAEKIRAFRARFLKHFKEALTRDSLPDTTRKAEFLLSLLWGIGVELKLGGEAAHLRGLVTYAKATVDSWQPTSNNRYG